MIPTAHPSQQPKRHPYRFSRLCTDDRRVSIYLTIGRPFSPKNLPLPMGDLEQGRSDGGYIGIYALPKSVPDQLFCALIAADVVRLLVYRTVVSCSKNYTHPKRISGYDPDLEPHLIHGSRAHPSPQPKRQLDWYSRFCRAH